MAVRDTIAEQCKRHGSQGGKVVRCIRCRGDIPEYAGRAVALYGAAFAHHPGKCTDQAEREAGVRSVAVQTTFGWSCAHVEPGSCEPDVCSIGGAERTAYVDHMRRAHGATMLRPSVDKIKLHKAGPAAKRQAPVVERPFKRLTWSQTHTFRTGDPDSIYGVKVETTVTEHTGQYWSAGETAHSLWAIEDMRSTGQANRLVQLYVMADGSVTPDWSAAASSRRTANASAKRTAERASRAA